MLNKYIIMITQNGNKIESWLSNESFNMNSSPYLDSIRSMIKVAAKYDNTMIRKSVANSLPCQFMKLPRKKPAMLRSGDLKNNHANTTIRKVAKEEINFIKLFPWANVDSPVNLVNNL